MKNSIIQSVTGTAIPLRGNDIDTDRIVPARYLRCVTFDGLGEHAFEDDREQDPAHPFNQPQYKDASILMVEKNFGCGSSREHAPQALHKWGIQGIIGLSFAEIFFANCQAIGIPCVTASNTEISELLNLIENSPNERLTIDVASATIKASGRSVQGVIPAGVQSAFLEGTWNATHVLLEAAAQVDELAKKLPYFRNFS